MYLPEKYKQSLPAKAVKDKFPKANIGRSCIRFKKTEDIDVKVLEEVIVEGANMMKKA